MKILDSNLLICLLVPCLLLLVLFIPNMQVRIFHFSFSAVSWPLGLVWSHSKLLTLFFRRRWVITVAFKKKKKKTSETRQSQLCAYITRSPVHGLLSCQMLCNLCHFSKSADEHRVHAWGQRSSSGLKTICTALSDSWAGQIFWNVSEEGKLFSFCFSPVFQKWDIPFRFRHVTWHKSADLFFNNVPADVPATVTKVPKHQS